MGEQILIPEENPDENVIKGRKNYVYYVFSGLSFLGSIFLNPDRERIFLNKVETI